MLVAGGASYLASAELYDPGSGTWSLTGSMADARAYHPAILLGNGFVMVIGGQNTAKLDSVELFDASYARGNLIVNSDADTDDGFCLAFAGGCTLREAIGAANGGGAGWNIGFAIPGVGVHTIVVSGSELPHIAAEVQIDGRSQPGYAGSPLIAIDGQIGTRTGLTISESGADSTIIGLDIQRFARGIELRGDGVTLDGNYIGVDATGMLNRGNTEGGIFVASSQNLIGGSIGNVISGNGTWGLRLEMGFSNSVRNNKIGTDASGMRSVGNGIGVAAYSPSNTIGGPSAGDGNLISGNRFEGIDDATGYTGITIQGNLIGTDISGSRLLSNGLIHGSAIRVSGSRNVIGGSIGVTPGGACTGACNVIAGTVVGYGPEDRGGISIVGASSNSVYGNHIGVDKTGAVLLGNAAAGVVIRGGYNNQIGGTAGLGNVIAGNGAGHLFETRLGRFPRGHQPFRGQ